MEITPIPIPEKISVKDAAYILGISPQMVRHYCVKGFLDAEQTFQGSGKWIINVDENIKAAPQWEGFVNSLKTRQLQSLALLNVIEEMANERIQELKNESEN